MVKVKLSRRAGHDKPPVALIVCDPKTSLSIASKHKSGQPGARGAKSQDAKGAVNLGKGRRPACGEITALSAESITIKPELPDFVAAWLQARGLAQPKKLQRSMTLPLNTSTIYLQNGQPVAANPFKVGDKVALVTGRDANHQRFARAVVDYATAKAKLEQAPGANVKGKPGPPGATKGSSPGRKRDGSSKAASATGGEQLSAAGGLILAGKHRKKQPQPPAANGQNGNNQGGNNQPGGTPKRHKGLGRLFPKRHPKHHKEYAPGASKCSAGRRPVAASCSLTA
jgi:hypothetical protein